MLNGIYPNYTLIFNGCSCDLINKSGTKLNFNLELLKNIFSEKTIKNIELFWYWNDNKSYDNKIKIDFNDFKIDNDNNKLTSNVCYRIFDKSKYESN